MEKVKRKIHNEIIDGLWIVQKGDVLPDAGSTEWSERLVVFWLHGGGFGSGNALTFASAHAKVINLYKQFDPNGKSLLYFSLNYPLAPGLTLL